MLAPVSRFLYALAVLLSRGILLAGWSYRAFGLRRVPCSGGVLLASTHQSHLDPVLIGIALGRPVHFMARSTLFEIPGFGTLIRALNAFPVRRGTADLEAMREGIRRLRAGAALLVFPEGTRSPDGRIQPIHPGALLLAVRAGVPVVPVIVDGANRAWPKHRSFPRPHPVSVRFGEPIPLPESSDREAISRRLTTAWHTLRAETKAFAPVPPVVGGRCFSDPGPERPLPPYKAGTS